MPELTLQTLFYMVFLSQIFLISFYLPLVLLGRVRQVVEKYPPSRYPKLYSVPIEAADRALRFYRNMNFFVLFAGLALVVIGIFLLPAERMRTLQEVTDFASYEFILTVYFFAQFCPVLIAVALGLPYFNLKRKADSRTTRRAELRRRRLSDFVSPTLFGLAVSVYLAFIVFVAYVRQFEFPWFGGYLNVVIITGVNLFFLGIAIRGVYGKKKDPYQAYEDRIRQIEFTLRTLLLVSIAVTVYTALGVTLKAIGLDSLTPIITSLYYQLLAVVSFREFRIDNVNFDVYREDRAAA
jgi:uncharacterized membrane protein (DUF485 family)